MLIVENFLIYKNIKKESPIIPQLEKITVIILAYFIPSFFVNTCIFVHMYFFLKN